MRRIRLLSWRTGVIHVVTAVITAERENMNTSIAEETGTTQAQAAGEKPKTTKKARVAPQGAHVAKKKGKPAKKATPAKKAPKADLNNAGRDSRAGLVPTLVQDAADREVGGHVLGARRVASRYAASVPSRSPLRSRV